MVRTWRRRAFTVVSSEALNMRTPHRDHRVQRIFPAMGEEGLEPPTSCV